MDDAGHGAVGVVADGVGPFARLGVELGFLRQELAGDGVGRVGRVDQLGDGRGDGDGVPGRHALQGGQPFGRDQAGAGEGVGRAKGGGGGHGARL